MRRMIAIADVPVLLAADELRRAAALERVFFAAPKSSDPPELTIRYELAGPQPPERSPDVATAQLRLWSDGTHMSLLDRSGVSARVTDSEIWIGGTTVDPLNGLQRACRSVLTYALAPRGVQLFHAGAVERDGRALLLLGASGMGKSTAAYAAHRVGWRVLSDDIAFIRRAQQSWQVSGLISRPVAVPAEAMGERAATGRPMIGDPRGRNLLDAVISIRGWFDLGGSVVIAHADQPEGEMHELGRDAVMAAVLKSSVASINPALLPAGFLAARAVAATPGFCITQGQDLASRLEGVEACFRSMAERISLAELSVSST